LRRPHDVGPFEVLFWIAEHWWILGLVAAAVLALTLWTGVVQLAAVSVRGAFGAEVIARRARLRAAPIGVGDVLAV